jgi:hypothetical protein
MAMKIKEKSFSEKQLIEKYFSESAILISETRCFNGRLAIWKNEISLPTRKACSFLSFSGEVFIPNCNDESFFSIFLEIKPNISDVEKMCNLISLMSPGLRKPIRQLQPYMQDIATIWHSPQFENGVFEAFFDNSTSGMIERITVDTEFKATVEIVGAGMRFDLR